MSRVLPLLSLVLVACSRPSTESSPDAGAAVSPVQRAIELARVEPSWARLLAEPSIARDAEAFATVHHRDAELGAPEAFGARLPRTADGAISVLASKHDPVTLRARDLKAREGALSGGRLAYADVAPETDLIVGSLVDRLELFYLLRTEQAPHRFALDVALPEGTSLRAEGEGTIAVADARGPFLRVERAFAVDAKGVKREAKLTIENGAVVVDLDPTGLAFPVLLDPAIDQVAWTDISPVTLPPFNGTVSSIRVTAPTGWARTFGSMAYGDRGGTIGGRAWLFGGTVTSSTMPGITFASRLYEWDGTAWNDTGVSRGYSYGPVSFLYRSGNIAYDATRDIVVWIGGYQYGPDSTPHLDLAEYDPKTKTFTGKCDGSTLCYASMPFVGATPSVVWAFGKVYMVYTNGLTYWDPALGKMIKPALPTGFSRSGPGLAFDSARNVIVAFGGTGGENDTWEFDGTTWKSIAVSSPPPGTGTPVLAYDSARKRTVLYHSNGSMYSWDGATWSLMTTTGTPSARNGAAFTYDAARGRFLMMGGNTADISTAQNANTSNQCFGDNYAPTSIKDYNRDYRYCNKLDSYVGVVYGGDCSSTRPCGPGTFCVDGVCCTSTCSGACQRCDAPGSIGVCKTVVSASDPDTCTGTSTCNATGSCRKLDGQACSAGNDCLSNNCIDGVCCNAACGGSCESCSVAGSVGTCTPLPKGSAGKGCGSYTCSGTSGACASSCAGDADCSASAFCDAGTCKPALGVGTTCARDRQCVGGHCADGVCCNAACDGACDVCSAALGASADGTCTNLPATATPTACGGFKCTGTSAECAASCSVDSDCAATAWCNGGTCVGKKAQGQSCDRGSQCQSGLTCADGVCCNEACDGACRACSAVNKASGDKSGECGPAREGTNPNAKCVKSDVTTCGLTGVCDGAGSCAKYAAGTGCGPTGSTTCDAGVVKGQTCDGLGTCRIDTAGTSCAPGACKDGACAWSCSDDSGCASSAWCDGGKCRSKGINGQKCTAGSQCQSGSCADGVCCNVACNGTCEACDVVGALGTCSPVVGEPRKGHPACPAADADNPCSARSCDGTDRTSCARLAGSEVTCRAASCSAEVATLSATCDGSGKCPDAVTQACQPYGCGDSKCKSTCTSDSDCKDGFVCDVARKACTAGASCTGSVVKQVDGTTLDCAPYACESTGNCKTSCVVSTDCVAPAICNSGKCAVPEVPVEEGGGCTTTHARGGSWFAAALLALGLVARRRRAVR